MAKETLKENIKIYDSIEDMPLYNFDRYTATSDLNWFLKKYTGREVKLDIPDLKQAEEKVLEEYFNAIEDRGLQSKLQKWAKINSLETKYNILINVIYVMRMGFDNTYEDQEIRFRYIQVLRGFGFKMDVMNSPHDDNVALDRISIQIEGIKTQIHLLRDDLKSDGRKEQMSLYKQLRMVANAMGRSEASDPKKITVAQWIADCQIMNELAKKN